MSQTQAQAQPQAQAQRPSQTQRAMLVVAFDSQVKWANAIGTALEAQGVTTEYVVCSDFRNSVSQEQLDSATDGAGLTYLPLDAFLRRALNVDIVVLAIQGPVSARLVIEMHDAAQRMDRKLPVLISGWVGVIIEKITAGYLERFACDIVAVNTRHDLRTFEHVARALQLPRDGLFLSGLPLLPGTRRPTRTGPIRTVLFADQPTVPNSAVDRAFLYSRLIDYANAHPERTVILKPRHRPEEDTFHHMKVHPAALLADTELPPNLVIDYTPITEMLDRIDLMLTISSTAALEAIAHGVPTAFLLDLGIHERLGNQIFLESGLLRTVDELIRDEIGEPAQQFLDDYFLNLDSRPVDRIAQRARELVGVAAEQRPSTKAFTTPYFASRRQLLRHRDDFISAAAEETGWRDIKVRSTFSNSLRSRAKAVLFVILPMSVLHKLQAQRKEREKRRREAAAIAARPRTF